jgi:hypothetical protein
LPQKMTLTAYLAQRGTKAKALTKVEADLLGIPYPLPRGWPRKYGAKSIDEVLFSKLMAHAKAARRVAETRGRSKKANHYADVCKKNQLPLIIMAARKQMSSIPGFVLRCPRRHSRKSIGLNARDSCRTNNQ